ENNSGPTFSISVIPDLVPKVVQDWNVSFPVSLDFVANSSAAKISEGSHPNKEFLNHPEDF
ncbi:hypothetical protein L9G74_20735, partial [Shewanella sp. C32]|nr:hypothetical protein [Shewanella electrica]